MNNPPDVDPPVGCQLLCLLPFIKDCCKSPYQIMLSYLKDAQLEVFQNALISRSR